MAMANQTLHQTPDTPAVLAGTGAGAAELNVERSFANGRFGKKASATKPSKWLTSWVFYC